MFTRSLKKFRCFVLHSHRWEFLLEPGMLPLWRCRKCWRCWLMR